MQLKKLFAICSLLFLGGCLHPIKPVLEVCVPDIPREESICGITGQGPLTNVTRFTLDKVDKATCFPPEEWKKIKSYIDELEAYVKQLESK